MLSNEINFLTQYTQCAQVKLNENYIDKCCWFAENCSPLNCGYCQHFYTSIIIEITTPIQLSYAQISRDMKSM